MRPLNILVFHNFYRQYGGEDESVQMEVELLSQNGHNVITYFEDSKTIDQLTISKKIVKSLNLIYSKKIIRKIREIIASEKPDLAHVHNVFPLITPSIYIALEEAGIPVVQSLRNYRFICPSGLLFLNGNVCRRCTNGNFGHAVIHRCLHGNVIQSTLYAASIGMHWILRTFPKRLGTLVALSEFMAKQLSPMLSEPRQIHVLPNFINLNDTQVGKDRGNYILYLGRLSPEKGVLLLVEAMKELPDLKLKIAGTGPIQDEITMMIHKNDLTNIEMLGHIRGIEKEALIGNALCLVVPSIWFEPFGRVVLESYANGTPAIASKIGGLQELVDEGHTGFLAEPGNINQLRDLINHVATNKSLIEELGQRAREVAEIRYSPESHYNKLMQIYRQVLK
jgi:glycosyltransferase involved in cell wall biosynthesis